VRRHLGRNLAVLRLLWSERRRAVLWLRHVLHLQERHRLMLTFADDGFLVASAVLAALVGVAQTSTG
jgi:hypothetical protein